MTLASCPAYVAISISTFCTNVSAFEAAAKHVDDPACTTNCTADCPEVDVSDLFGIAATRMIGCCLPDGTCGGTAQSLPMFAQTAFGTPQCFSLPSISAAFAALNTPWQVQLPPPTKCQP
ncbi:MAG TPA: hypothetical protein PKD61_14690 [Polyangiaceae bacterium]|nr:hypothetical protein [Polyangiaceae bacterium]